MENKITLIGLDIEGPWNIPLLKNAAEISEASMLFIGGKDGSCDSMTEIETHWQQFDHVIACEAMSRSCPIYQYPAPRGRLGVIVGNEKKGIHRSVLKKAERVVAVPMLGRSLSSVNVAVAAAIVLFSIERGYGRRRLRTVPLSRDSVELLIVGPSDPSELGSLLRSAWAFGWQRVFLDDRHEVWFTKDRPTVLASRAASRREVNRIVVNDSKRLRLEEYDHIIISDTKPHGTPLSRFSLPSCGKILLVIGDDKWSSATDARVDRVHIDCASNTAEGCFRHLGSILLSVVSYHLGQGCRG